MYKYDSTKEIRIRKNSNENVQMIIPVINEDTGNENTLYVGTFREYCIQSGWDEHLTGDFSSSPNFDMNRLAFLPERDSKAIIGMAITCALFELKGAYSILINPITIEFIDLVYKDFAPHYVEFDPDKRLSDQPHTITHHDFDPDKSIFDQEWDHTERYDPDKPVLRRRMM